MAYNLQAPVLPYSVVWGPKALATLVAKVGHFGAFEQVRHFHQRPAVPPVNASLHVRGTAASCSHHKCFVTVGHDGLHVCCTATQSRQN